MLREPENWRSYYSGSDDELRLQREGAPLDQRAGSPLFVDLASDEMALLIEMVVDLSMDGAEFCSVFMLRNRCMARSRRRNG